MRRRTTVASAGKMERRILEATFDTMSERGYEETSIAEIAHRAGINEVTIYRHYCTKENLFSAMTESMLQERYKRLMIDFEPTEDIVSDLTKMSISLTEIMISNAKLARLIFMELENFPAQTQQFIFEAVKKITDSLSRYFTIASEKGLIGKVEAELAAVAFFSFFYRSMIDTAYRKRDPLVKINKSSIRQFVTLFVYGIMKDESRIQ